MPTNVSRFGARRAVGLRREERLDELAGLEGGEVLQLLGRADEAHGPAALGWE